MSWQKVKLKEVLKQYRNIHLVEDKDYRQVTISQTGEISYRGTKHGSKIGRKRQFFIDLKNHPNTLIFIRQGVFKGGIGICPKEVDECIVTENMPMFDIININPEYLLYYIKSPQFKSDVDKLVPLGTAQKAIHERQLLEVEIPLPSKEIQDKIIRQLKNNSNEISELDVINNKNESYISKLRQQILQEAVQGKLVNQDPKDEPASELLKKIKAEKDKLIKEKKIKREKPLAPISEDEIHYALPKSWSWVRLGDIIELISGQHIMNELYNNKNLGMPYLTGPADFGNINPIISKWTEKPKVVVINKDILITVKGAGLGKLNIVNREKVCISRQLMAIRNRWINNYYIFLFLNEKFQHFQDSGVGIAIPGLDRNDILDLVFPFPPLSEQKLIVEKVNQLMRLCDELEKQVKDNQKNSEKLMEDVLRESFQ